MIAGRIKARSSAWRDVTIELGKVALPATLSKPASAEGIVIFADGSGSSRISPRNCHVAEVLQGHRIATLLLDLLTEDEEAMDRRTSLLSINSSLLAKRLAGATLWTMRQHDLHALELGYLGTSAGAAAALIAAGRFPESISALVSVGGRTDFAAESLGSVRAPTLLIVGGYDRLALALNEQAMAKLGSREKKLLVIRGATQLLEEPGTMEEMAQAAADWFSDHFSRNRKNCTRHAL